MTNSWRRLLRLLLAPLALAGCEDGYLDPVMDHGLLFNGRAFDQQMAYQVYYGTTHTHVSSNGDDGAGTLEQAYQYVQEKAGMDFVSISSHSHMIDDGGYQAIRVAADRVTRPGRFVAIVGQEWSSISKGGHINIFEASERCPLSNGDWEGFYERWLPRHPEVAWVQFNHPHPGNPREFGGRGFSPLGPALANKLARAKVAGMAMINGPGKYPGEDMRGVPDEFDRGLNGLNYEEEYKEFLNRGWRIGALADQDNHTPNWGMAAPSRTGIWAKSLTKADVADAFINRRTFGAFDNNVRLWFSVNGLPMGSEVPAGPLQAEVAATDPDTPFQRLEIYGDLDGPGGQPAQLIEQYPVGGNTAKWNLTLKPTAPGGYYFAKLVYQDRTAWAWTSPVWVGGPLSR